MNPIEQYREALLEALARVRADGETDYAQVILRAAAQDNGHGILVLFEDAAANTAPGGFAATGRQRLIRIRFDADSFRYPARRTGAGGRQRGNGEPVYDIVRGADLASVFAT